MARVSSAKSLSIGRGSAFWANDFSRAPNRGSSLTERFAAKRAVAAIEHPQSFGNYFTYGAAIPILGLGPRAPFADGSLQLARGYCDFGYLWSQFGPPETALAALAHPLSVEEVASYPPDLADPLRDMVAKIKFGRMRDHTFDVLGMEGAQGAIGYAFLSFLDRGNEVLITDPGYMHFNPGPQVAGARVRCLPLTPSNRFRLDPDEVAAHLSPHTKMLILCDPINPFGTIQTREELLAIARNCEHRNVLVLNNITHATHQINPTAVHTPMAALFRETCLDHVISIAGMSKGYALAALRLGFMAGHPDLLRSAARIRMEITGIHIHPFAQRAALAALPDADYVQTMTKLLRRNLAHIRETLRKVGEVALAIEPEYGFCACLDVSASGVSAQELTVALFRQGICVIAGDALGELGATRYLRINYSSPNIENFEHFRHALPIAIRDARSGRYREGVIAFYHSKPGSRAKRILAQLRRLENRRIPMSARRDPFSAPGSQHTSGAATAQDHLQQIHVESPRSAKENTMSSNLPPSLISQLKLEYGPLDTLGTFFAEAYDAARAYGVHLSFGTFEQLLQVNLDNLTSWRAIIPTFDPRFSELNKENAFCLLGYNQAGDVVATQACRLFRWEQSTFFEAAQDLTLFYAHPVRDRLPDETCEITAESARNIRGRVAFSGAGWYRPDFRGKFLSLVLPRISRAYAFTRWSTDYTTSMFQDAVLAGGMAERCGYTNIDWHVDVKHSPMGDIKFAFVWMEPDELINDLRRFDGLIHAEVDRRIRYRRA